ncbi:flavin reductase (DIM6/NTAB) family NADH-FMN oxidoreductase RutF [Rhodoligotrophos appendicifer]|uniref:flavin reductase family protein n=1 Tax=Rhodoligotrophos appendicifer TaxID=987056 RepID=UPI0014786A1A|nr:flavin reductase family protein [Rhodoligotrophos appendicifer]
MIANTAGLSIMDDTAVPADHPEPTKQEMRHALGHFATGVTVITAIDPDGNLCGLTANAFSAVSLEPPLILACIDRSVRCYEAILATRLFTVHILHSDQAEVALSFARKGGDRSKICEWNLTDHGRPLMSSFHAALECSLHEAHHGGDHAIVIGRVARIHIDSDSREPLLYYRGQMLNGVSPTA